VLRVGVLVLAGLLAVLIVTVGQDFGPAPVVLRVGEAAPQTYIAPARVSVVDLAATETARSEAAAQVADVYRIDTQVNETVLEDVADVFATVAMVAEPVLPPETTTTTGAETTTSSTAPGDTTTTSEPTTTTTLPAEFQPRTEQIILVKEAHNLLNDLTIAALVDLVNGDRARLEAGDTELFPLVRQEAVDIAKEYLSRGIKAPELGEVRSELVTLPPPLVLLPDELRGPAEAAVADVVQLSLQANELRDDAPRRRAWRPARQFPTRPWCSSRGLRSCARATASPRCICRRSKTSVSSKRAGRNPRCGRWHWSPP
jgi:membrane-associated HD superfamily phosphohydrolase